MMESMNIAALSRTTYWQGIKGGMDLHGKLLSEGLVKRGHQISIISTIGPNGLEFEERNRIKLYYLKNTVFGSRRKGWQKESRKKLLELHRRRPFDVIWSQSFDAFGLSSFQKEHLNVPMVAILHGCMQQELRSFLKNIFNNRIKQSITSFAGLWLTYLWIQRSVISFSDKIIAVSQEVATSFEKRYGRKFSDKCVIVANGVDPSIYAPRKEQRIAVRGRYGLGDEDFLIMTIGRITREKGFHIALEALRRLIDRNMQVKLMIVGSGEYLEEIKRMVLQCGLKDHVIFTGFVENSETANFYNGADIVLNPSLTAEGCPFVVLEAMACGKPVVASKVGGINSILSDGENGFLVEPGNSEMIAEKIQLIAASKNRSDGFSTSARKTVLNQFTTDGMVDRTLAVMQAAFRH